jgi:hypothetical protein
MIMKPGARMRSQVCTTEIIVVRPAASDIVLSCGGEPMVDLSTEIPSGAHPAPGLDAGSALGKRYTENRADATLEVLVTKHGDGTLSIGDTALVEIAAKPLPSSD